MIRAILFFLIVGFNLSLKAQTMEQWVQNVGWDGISHWSEYLIFSPKFTGPNAMPVPLVSDGRVANESYIRVGGQYQWITGDQTANATFHAGHTFLKNRISIDLFMVPFEVYKLSDARKIERNVYFENFNKKSAIGDLYVNTNVQLFDEEDHSFDFAIRVGLKTASSGLDNPARFIDSPGYYFDGSMGKTYSMNGVAFRPYAMLGFFAWQTNDESLRQNDALLYGVGLEVVKNRWTISQTFRGYSGYQSIGDKPMVMRTSISRDINRSNFLLNYQYGLRDYLYQSIELSYQFIISKI